MRERKAGRRLRHKGKTCQTKSYSKKRGIIAISHTSDKRPISAQNQSRFGHWEADTVLGAVGGACLVTLTGRKTRFKLVKKVLGKKSKYMKEAMIGLLQSHKLRSVTPNRGKEFAKYRLVLICSLIWGIRHWR